jgi:hypothetical protein
MSNHGREVMSRNRRNMPQELRELQDRLRALLRANMDEARRTQQLLRDTERKVEDQFGHLDFVETSWYTTGKKFRKEPGQDTAPRL